MYFQNPETVVNQLHNRWHNATLRQKVMDFLGNTLPEGFPDHPVAILSRHLPIARYEDIAYAQIAQNLNLEPWWNTYASDRFVTKNPDKVSYVNLPVEEGSGFRKIKVVSDIPTLERRKVLLKDISTRFSTGNGKLLLLPDLHRKLRELVMPQYAANYYDVSHWWHSQAKRRGAKDGENLASFYYASFLALGICHSVLFEDWDGGPNVKTLKPFVQSVVVPALEKIKREIGVEPLMIRFPWKEEYKLYPAIVSKLLI